MASRTSFTIRYTDELRALIDREVAATPKSKNQVIIERLEASYRMHPTREPAFLSDLDSVMEKHLEEYHARREPPQLTAKPVIKEFGEGVRRSIKQADAGQVKSLPLSKDLTAQNLIKKLMTEDPELGPRKIAHLLKEQLGRTYAHSTINHFMRKIESK